MEANAFKLRMVGGKTETPHGITELLRQLWTAHPALAVV